MKDILTKNLGYKIGALCIAILLWIYVVNAENPLTNRTITGIPISFINTEVFTENQMTYEISGSQTASVTVSIPRTDRTRVDRDDFKAVIDCNLINDLNGAAQVAITYTGDYANSNFSWQALTNTVQIVTEQITSLSWPVDLKLTGEDLLASGCIVFSQNVSPATVTVTAPKSKLENIASASVEVDVSAADSPVSGDFPIAFFDRWGEEIPISEEDEEITLSASTATATVTIYPTDQALVDCSQVMGADKVADGFRFNGITSSMETVKLAGDPMLVNGINSIVIPAEELDVTGASESFSKEIDLSAYLPQGVRIVGGSTVKIDFSILKVDTKEISYVTGRINWIGQNTEYRYRILDVGMVMPVTLSGLEGELENVVTGDFNLTLDVSGLKPGTHEVAVTSDLVGLSDSIEMVSPRSLTVQIIGSADEYEEEELPEETEAAGTGN